MLLIIHNLPSHFRYIDIKAMIQSKCGLTELILDNLVPEGKTKKVTVGLAEESDAAILVRKVNGLFIEGQQLYVEDVRQKKASDQPYRAQNIQQLPSEDYNKYSASYQEAKPVYSASTSMSHDPMPFMLNYNMQMGGMYYVPTLPAQTALMGYGGQAAPHASMLPQFPNTVQQDTFGLKPENNEPNSQRSNAVVWESNEDVAHHSNRNQHRQPPTKRGHNTNDNLNPIWNNQGDDLDQSLGNRNWNSQNQYQIDFKPYKDESTSYQAFSAPYEDHESRSQQRMPPQSKKLEYSPQKPAFRSEMYNSNTFRNPMAPGTSDRSVSFRGINAAESIRSSSSRWDQPKTDSWDFIPTQSRNDLNQDRPERNQFTSRRQNVKQELQKMEFDDRKQGQRATFYPPRNDRYQKQELDSKPNFSQDPYQNRPQREDPKSFHRDQEHSIPRPSRPSRPVQNFIQKPKFAPQKRFSDRRDDYNQPQKKRFADQSTVYPRSDKFVPPKKISSNPVLQRTDSASKSAPFWKNANISKKNKNETLRYQATSQIAREMLNSLEIIGIGRQDGIIKCLKRSIKARIDDLLGDKLFMAKDEIIMKYRQKFTRKEDQAFFLDVLDKYHSETDEDCNKTNTERAVKPPLDKQPQTEKQIQKEKPVQKDKPAQKEKPAEKEKPIQNEKSAPAKDPSKTKVEVKSEPDSGPAKLPKYPNADKKLYIEQKQIQKQEYQDESLYELAPALQKALDEQCDILCDLFMGECEKPDNEKEKPICERIMDLAADEFRKVLRVNVTKRLLNIKTGLLVRIFCNGRPPPRAALDSFLQGYGVISLKKSDKQKMFIATCDSYQHYDKLCGLGIAEVDGVTLTFKPLHVCGPPPKITRAEINERRRKFIESQIDDSGEDILPKKPKEEVDFSEDVGPNEEDVGVKEDFSEDVGVEEGADKGDNKLQNKVKPEVDFSEDVDVKVECFKEENNDALDVGSVDDEDLEDY